MTYKSIDPTYAPDAYGRIGADESVAPPVALFEEAEEAKVEETKTEETEGEETEGEEAEGEKTKTEETEGGKPSAPAAPKK